jgi:hypothetical protein
LVFKIGEILSSLSNSTSSFDEATGEFLPIDVETAKRNLKLAERAQENGETSVPSAASSRKDSMAVEIDNYINYLIQLAKDKFVDRLKAIDELNKFQSGSLGSITEIYERARAELKMTARDRYNNLFTAKRAWLLGEDEFSAFRKEHHRVGPARYPADRVKVYGWLFLITVFEIVTNAYALGATHPNGPIGVVLEIFMFGIANIGVAFLLGCYIWRYFFHISLVKKTFATVLALPMLTFTLFLNFFLAHYRDAISKLADNELSALQMMTLMQKLGGQARDTLIQSPFAMDDFKSYLLLFVGLLASIFAIKKSFELDDPYPGYGKLSREQDELASNFNDEQTFAFNDMNDLVEDYSSQINTQLGFVKSGEARLNTRDNDKKQLFEKFNNWLSVAQSVGEALYAFYREENMKAREDKKEPKCFGSTSFKLSANTNVKLDAPKRTASNYGSIEKTCKEYLGKLNIQSTEFQKKFKDIENMSPDQVLGSEFKEPTVFKD